MVQLQCTRCGSQTLAWFSEHRLCEACATRRTVVLQRPLASLAVRVLGELKHAGLGGKPPSNRPGI